MMVQARLDIDREVLRAQRKEMTEHAVYRALARGTRDSHNRHVLERMAQAELEEYHLWKAHTHEDTAPDPVTVFRYVTISRLLGMTFAIKLLERDSRQIRRAYDHLSASIPNGKTIMAARLEREKQLIGLINEDRLKYISAVVLGLNDALVELTAVLAGFTLALQDTMLIAVAGLITGIAAALSMGASVFLSTESEAGKLNPLRASVYTGLTYLLTVLFLIYPYLLLGTPIAALGLTVADAILLIAAFTYYSSVARDMPFASRFGRMAAISLGIAAITFGIGFTVRKLLNVNI